MLLHLLADKFSVRLKHHKSGALIGDFRAANGDRVILVEPESYMNLSGNAVGQLAKFYKTPAANTIILHDELDLDFGRQKLKIGGGHAGHNGLRSIIPQISADFIRLRMGIGRPPGQQPTADFVLSRFNSTEQKELPLLLELGADMVLDVITQGLLEAQQRHH